MSTLSFIHLPGRASLLVLAALVPSLVSCASSGVNQGDFNIVSLEEEWQLGRKLEADLAQRLRLVRDPAAQRYLDRLGQRLVAQTEMARCPGSSTSSRTRRSTPSTSRAVTST